MAIKGLLATTVSAGVLLLVTSGASAAEYASFAACARAGETPETCERLYPQPKAPPPKPMPLEACTGMLHEATEQTKQAIIFLRFDSLDESERRAEQAAALLRSATACVKTVTSATQAAQAAWRRQQNDYDVQINIFEAALDAKGR